MVAHELVVAGGATLICHGEGGAGGGRARSAVLELGSRQPGSIRPLTMIPPSSFRPGEEEMRSRVPAKMEEGEASPTLPTRETGRGSDGCFIFSL